MEAGNREFSTWKKKHRFLYEFRSNYGNIFAMCVFWVNFCAKFFVQKNTSEKIDSSWKLVVWSGHFEIIDNRTKTKGLFINLSSNYFEGFTVGVESFFGPFQPRPEERKTSTFEREPQRSPYTIINFSSSQNSHSLRACSQFWEQGRTAGG